MLTSVCLNPNTTVVNLPPFYDRSPFEAALHHTHRDFVFMKDNEVVYTL